MAKKYLDYNGLSYFWAQIKAYVASQTGGGGGSGAHATKTATLSSSGWSGGSQTVTVSGITSSNDIIVTYAPASRAAWIAAGVYCSAQGTNSLTFTCTTTPSTNLTAQILLLVSDDVQLANGVSF